MIDHRLQLSSNSIKALSADANGWIRDPKWLSMPSISPTDQKVAMLYPVVEYGPNNLAFTIHITDATQYTVDWGDGTIQDINSGTKADHTFTFSAIPASTQHSVFGYRQVIVTVTPKTAGKTFSKVLLDQIGARAGLNAVVYTLDVVLSAPNATDIRASNSGTTLANLERFAILSCASPQADWRNMFTNTPVLKSIFIPASATATYVSQMFYYKCSDVRIPVFNTSANTSLNSMAAYAFGLKEFPAFDLNSTTDINNIVQGCYSIRRFKAININSSIDLQPCDLERDAIIEVFGNLKTLAFGTGKSINITGNPGVIDLTVADWNIAAAKQWVIYPAGAAPAITDDGSLNVTITSSGGHLVYPVYYTLASADPTVSGILYTGPFAVPAFSVVTAIEYRPGYGPTNRPHPYAIIT